MKALWLAGALLVVSATTHAGEEMHQHPAPEKLGTVRFDTTCLAAVQRDFERSVALLHSFAYDASAKAFAAVAKADPACAMAHWGIAMAQYHQLWSPPDAAALLLGRTEIAEARRLEARSDRERDYIAAAASYFEDGSAQPPTRAQAYANAMAGVAARNPKDTEAQVFYALALIATAPPTDRTHANQKQAVALLEPVFQAQPEHPGAAHYLIHGYDSAELASRGVAAARAYSKIAPSAPHALHMPSHIFTRLGLWNDSIASNTAARAAARAQGDVGEELHAMDYLTYAYLQTGRDSDARRIVDDLRAMGPLLGKDFKVGYAATAMPVRLAMERQQWAEAAALQPLPQSAPQVAAIVYWARAVAQARSGSASSDPLNDDLTAIDACEQKARAAGDLYWATQIQVLGREVRAWRAASTGQPDQAVLLLQSAAALEDGLEKLPVTPGPIVPAREQLGQLLLDLQRPQEALVELRASLSTAPGRRGALAAAATAADRAGQPAAAAQFRALLAAR